MRANLIAALVGVLCVAGCGGGGSSVGGGGNKPPSGANVQPITVDSGPAAVANSNNPAVNTLYTTVRLCIPGTSTCQDIDHIQVDTGSSGLRILSTALTLSLSLQKNSAGNVVAECVHFVDGSSWGPLRLADIKIAGEVASNQQVQIIGDSAYQTIPNACIGSGTAENTVAAFGANGILGVGPFVQDCGPSCEQAGGATYYTCTSSTACTDTAMPLAQQLTNPVTAFATDNNGVIIQLPVLSSTAATVSGSIIFGIGTQGNNGIGSAKVILLDSVGALTTTYKTQTLGQSFIDSGSNAYYFPDSSIDLCAKGTHAPGFFCPPQTLNLSATITGGNNVSSMVNFTVANADSLFNTTSTVAAAVTLAAPSTTVSADGSTFSGTDTFDWGLPFYFGRNVYTAIENHNTSAGMGPYFAF
ncbi:MAG: DUF3443 domain-containing protein [Steroidobacteraceae bacterium]